jgi:hypothetical protein
LENLQTRKSIRPSLLLIPELANRVSRFALLGVIRLRWSSIVITMAELVKALSKHILPLKAMSIYYLCSFFMNILKY